MLARGAACAALVAALAAGPSPGARLSIDSFDGGPPPGATPFVQHRGGDVRMTGWAVGGSVPPFRPLAGVHVLVDGRAVTDVAYGARRDDVAHNLGAVTDAHVGYSARFASDEFRAGRHTITFLCEAQAGRWLPCGPAVALEVVPGGTAR
jgi:hypothetical protein